MILPFAVTLRANPDTRLILILMIPLIVSLVAALWIRRGNLGLFIAWLLSLPIVPAIVIYQVYFVPGGMDALWVIGLFVGAFMGAVSGAIGVGIAVALKEIVAYATGVKD